MLFLLKRHPFTVRAVLQKTLVLTYALPESVVRSLVPAGLTAETFRSWGFAAIALVRTRALRPALLPEFFGKNFFFAGLRVFVRFHSGNGKTLRGLRILRTYTNSHRMSFFGNLLTHYSYRTVKVRMYDDMNYWNLSIRSKDGKADLDLEADLAGACLPSGSPFESFREARRFAGPLPYTFDYEKQTHSIIRVEGVRKG